MRIRALAPAVLVLLAGCTATPLPGKDGAPPGNATAPPAEGIAAVPEPPLLSREVWLAEVTLDAPGRVVLPPQLALALPGGMFEADESSRTITVWNSVALVGQGLVRLHGAGEAGWAVLLGPMSEQHGEVLTLRVETPDGNASLHAMLSGRWLRVEQLPLEGTPCRGHARYGGGAEYELGEDGGGWSTGVPEGDAATLNLQGPGGCDGLVVRYAHLGRWVARPPP